MGGGGLASRNFYLDPAHFSNLARIYHIDLAKLRTQETCQQCIGKRLAVERSGRAGVLDLHLVQGLFRQLSSKATELFGELQVRRELSAFLCRQRRRIKRLLYGTFEQIVAHLLGDLLGDLFLCLAGRCA